MVAPSTPAGRRSARSRGRSNGEGTVFEDKPNRRWVGMITVGWEYVDDGKGGQKKRQIRKSVSGPTKRDVMLKLRQFQTNADAGVPVPDQQITVGLMLDQWLEEVLPGTVAKPTEQQYQDVARLYIKPRLGKKKLRDLTPTDVTRMLRDMEQPTETRPNGYSQNARRLARSVLRRAIRWAEVEGMVSRNVAALANPVRVERPEGRTMTPEQARVFLDHIKGDRNEALFVVALTLGLRVSELIAVSWDDVNLDPPDGQRPTLTVRRGIKRVKGEGLIIGGLKTKTSRRTVHLPEATAECLRRHRRRQDAEALAFSGEWPERPLGIDLVFRTTTGTALDPSNVWHYLSEATQHAGAEYEDEDRTKLKPGTGLGHWHPHELRHSAGSLLLAQGVPLKMISEMLGHSSITVTADVYAHVLAPAKDDVAAAMDRAIGGGSA
ncbi:MAG TPA: site-specific integrase [Ilumatobacter sp.]|nr:site-specific integrase [Ilumatobacter sp.]